MIGNKKIKVLFLCTGNSCRSQMAQGWAEFLKSDSIDAYSAGTMPCYVHPKAIEVMTEAGVDISNHSSKHIDDLAGIEFDYVITLCDSANEHCPILPGGTKRIHQSFTDPAATIGTTEDVMNAFRKTRDQIRAFIETFPDSLKK
ncbi:MAG: arsenate reductase ArsC [Planctomycetes bacterium]|nr:arsenate reductase ArsC [Planctomycetota bacterium]